MPSFPAFLFCPRMSHIKHESYVRVYVYVYLCIDYMYIVTHRDPRLPRHVNIPSPLTWHGIEITIVTCSAQLIYLPPTLPTYMSALPA